MLTEEAVVRMLHTRTEVQALCSTGRRVWLCFVQRNNSVAFVWSSRITTCKFGRCPMIWRLSFCSSVLMFSAFSQVVIADQVSSVEAKSAEPVSSPPMFNAGYYGVIGGVSDSPAIAIGATIFDDLFAGVGLTFSYDGAGQPNSEGARTSNNTSSGLTVVAQYMVFDHHPFAMGPELFVTGSLAPGKAFAFLQLQPGWSFWYSPFKAPIAIGSALDVQIQVPRSRDQSWVFNLITPGLRFGYIFNGI